MRTHLMDVWYVCVCKHDCRNTLCVRLKETKKKTHVARILTYPQLIKMHSPELLMFNIHILALVHFPNWRFVIYLILFFFLFNIFACRQWHRKLCLCKQLRYSLALRWQISTFRYEIWYGIVVWQTTESTHTTIIKKEDRDLNSYAIEMYR